MPKHIGIVACSAEGAALCYRTICDEAPALMGRHMHPEISMHTHCLGEYMEHIGRYDWQGVAELMLSSADKLAKTGADFLISPDNTIHHAFDLVVPRSPLPWLHIVDEVAAVAKSRGFHKLAITGTKYTMEGTVYQTKLPAAGIEYLVPDAARSRRNRSHHHGRAGERHLHRRNRALFPAGDWQDEPRRVVMPWCWVAPRFRC